MSSAELILVTGASGQIGGAIAEFLSARDVRLRLVARDVEKLKRFSSAEHVAADYSDIASLDRAFAGVQKAFIVSGNAKPHERALLHRNAFEAAKRAGVEYIVYLSFLGAAEDSLFPMSQDHFDSQNYLVSTGIPFTALQDSFYAELAVEMFDAEGVLKAPAGNGAVSWVGRREVAEAVSNLLVSPAPALGILPTTGPRAYTLAETAAALSELTGRIFHYEQESLEAARLSRMPLAPEPWVVDVWVGSYRAIAAGEVATVSDDLGRILDRAPSDLTTYLAQHPEFLKG